MSDANGAATEGVADAALQDRIHDALNPAMLDRILEGASIDTLAAGYREAMAVMAKGWITAAVCVGRAQEAAGYGDDVLGGLAQKFDAGVRHLARFGQIYREIIKPRIERDGDRAEFLLEEQGWYRVAIEAAPKVEKLPAALIEEAEEKKARDPKYSPARWREDLEIGDADEGSTTSKQGSLLRAIGKLAKAEDSEAEEIAAALDRTKLTNIEEAYSWLDRLLIAARERMEGRRA